MGMILYDVSMSPNGKRARLGLAETGEPYETRQVNLIQGEQKTEEYKKIHPLGRIPVLDDDGVIIWESGAILLYVADKFPEAKLIPTKLSGRGHVYQWLMFAEAQIHSYMGAMGFQMMRRAPDKRDQSVLDRGRKRMPELLQAMDDQLAGKDYLVDDFSIADCACAPWLDFAPNVGIKLTPFENVQAWLLRMKERPSWKA